jgi:hypothetical protein
MQLTKLRAAPVRQAEVPPCAPAGEMNGGTASQLIRGVLRTWRGAVRGTSATVLVGMMLTACGGYSERSYRGDGRLHDHGWYSGSGRYTLDLGQIDLGVRGVRRFSLANLPPERLALGFGLQAEPPAGVEIHVRLVGQGRTVIDQLVPLASWLRSGSRDFRVFLYCPGVGETWSEAPGTAWGSVFRPQERAAYELTIEVTKAGPSGAGATLIVEGGPRDILP